MWKVIKADLTKAAQKSFAEGLAMLPAAGNSIVRLPPNQADTDLTT
jgi:hypothetical protein